MIIIPGQVISLLTFPGIVLHEIAHRLFCDLTNVPVYQINYFRVFSKQAGHVIHERTDSLTKSFLIGAGPLIVNSLVCMLLTIPYGYSQHLETDFLLSASKYHSLYIILMWMGYSIGLHSIPSNKDLEGFAGISSIRFVSYAHISFPTNYFFI